MSKADLQTIEKKVAEETKNVEQAKARLQQLHARKSELSNAERTRRLILIGKVIVSKADKEEDFKVCLMKWLDEGITAERDRALFDLSQDCRAR